MDKNEKCDLLIALKKHIWIILFSILFIIPISIQTNFLYVGKWILNFINIGKPGNWLGFWGSYLGSVLAVLFAYVNTKIQLKENKKNEYEKAIKLRELDSTISLLQAAAYLQNQVNSLKNEFKFNKYKNYYKDLRIDTLAKIYEIQNNYTEKYNSSIIVYNAEDPKNIVKQEKKITNYYTNLVRTVNINFFDEISDKIKNQHSERISDIHKKTFSTAYNQAKDLLTECEKYTDIIDHFYEDQKKQITR